MTLQRHTGHVWLYVGPLVVELLRDGQEGFATIDLLRRRGCRIVRLPRRWHLIAGWMPL